MYEDILDAFKIFDYNSKGVYNEFELEKIMTEYGFKIGKEEFMEFVSFAPRNENEDINYEEFAHFLSLKTIPEEVEKGKKKGEFIGFENKNLNRKKRKSFKKKIK